MEKLSLIDVNKPQKVKEALNEVIDFKENLSAKSLGLGNVDNTSDLDKPISNKQQAVLDEITKTLSETEAIAKGASVPLWYNDYSSFIDVFNSLEKQIYKSGQNINIVTVNVPDLWVIDCAEENIQYTYVDDESFVNELINNGKVQIGHYMIGMLETQKIVASEYVKFTDYPNQLTAGVVKIKSSYGITMFNENGDIGLTACPDENIINKSGYCALNPKKIDLAVKTGMTTNALEWSEDEKQSATDLIDAVKRVEFSTTQTVVDGSYYGSIGRAYIRDRNNQENSIVVHCQNMKYTVPCRDANGNFYVGSPTQVYHCANKGYVDDKVASLVNSAPETLDTLGELATALQENGSVVATLDSALTQKANQEALDETNAKVLNLEQEVGSISELIDSLNGEVV